MITALSATLATGAFAKDFDRSVVTITGQSQNLQFSVDLTKKDDIAAFETKARIGEFKGVEAFASLGYITGDQIALGVEGKVNRQFSEQLNVYAVGNLDYVAPASAMDKGEWYVTPQVGAVYQINPKVDVFGEVGYSWVASQEWQRSGGYAEIGANYHVTDTLTIKPSLVRGIDDGLEETNLHVETIFQF